MRNAMILIVMAITIAGCAFQNAVNSRAMHVVVRAGVAEFVDGEKATAQSVISWTEEVIKLLEGNPEMLVAELQSMAMDLIPWTQLTGGQRIIAIEVLAYIEARFAERIEDGEIPEDATMGFRDLLETARWAAEFQLALIE